ncbi:MAG: glycosyltransferase family 39 protein [Dehalococcoidia bacterium]|nr:glycosyltransferase family 39 protein [Dehalococcoidia bacterium]
MAALVVLLVAAALRFGQIESLPAGLQHDEAAYGLDAYAVARLGDYQIFYERSNGREPLYIYLLAGSFALLDVGVWQMRIVSAALGLLTVAAVARLATDLFGWRVGVLAMALVAMAYWPLHVSHTAFRAVSLPLIVTLAAIAFWRAATRGGWRRGALAGALLGLAMYTYLSSRVLPIVIVAWLVAAWWIGRGGGLRLGRSSALALIAAYVVVFAPLATYYATHWDAFSLRSAQVNDLRPIVLEGDFRPLIADSLATLGMFLWRGDDSWKYNLSGRPVFDPVSGALFLGGVAMLLAGAARQADPTRRFAWWLLLIWLVALLAPGMISGESPHFLRTIGALPVVFLLPAVAIDWALDRVGASRLAIGAVVVGLGVFGGRSAIDLFGHWANAPEQRAFFRADLAEVARFARAHPATPLVIATEYPYDLDPLVVQLAAGRPVAARYFDGRHAALVPAAGGALVVPTFVDLAGPGIALPPHPRDRLAVLSVAETRVTPPPHPIDAQVGPYLRLVGTHQPETAQAGDTVTVPLTWRVTSGGAPADLSFSVKLVGPWDSVWAQHDLSPAPPADWQMGDQFVIRHRLALDPALAPGVYRLVAQVYQRETIQPLPITVADQPPSPSIDLGTLTVQRGDPATRARTTPRFATSVTFGDQITLVGYDIDKPVAATGELLGVTLYWRALRGDLPDWTVFTHLIHDAEPTALYGQRDSQPVFGAYPTTQWQAGETIKDWYGVPIATTAPAGGYRIAVGLYRRDTGERLPVTSAPVAPIDQIGRALGRIGLPYRFDRAETDRVLLRPIRIERR